MQGRLRVLLALAARRRQEILTSQDGKIGSKLGTYDDYQGFGIGFVICFGIGLGFALVSVFGLGSEFGFGFESESVSGPGSD